MLVTTYQVLAAGSVAGSVVAATRRTSTGRPNGARGDHCGDPRVWDEIAGRLENEGQTPTD